MTCKECNHFDVCCTAKAVENGNPMITDFRLCNKAQNKERVFVFPCGLGDTVYLVVRGRVHQCLVADISYYAKWKKTMLLLETDEGWCCSVNYEYEFGYSLFFERCQADDVADQHRKGR